MFFDFGRVVGRVVDRVVRQETIVFSHHLTYACIQPAHTTNLDLGGRPACFGFDWIVILKCHLSRLVSFHLALRNVRHRTATPNPTQPSPKHEHVRDEQQDLRGAVADDVAL